MITPYHLPDGPAEIVRLPGVPAPGPANAALFAAARRIDAARVFVAGPGAAATALWAARSGAAVTFWTENAAEAESLDATFTQARLAGPRRCVQADFAGLEPESCDIALLHLPRGSDLQAEALALAAAMLREGGRLVFVGATNEGIKGAVKQAKAIFGQAGIVARKGGYHAGLAQRPRGAFPLPAVNYAGYDIIVDGHPTRLVSCAGAFARDRLDAGAAALVAGMQVTAGRRVLDLGCGTGLAGLAALRRGAEVTLVDVSARAAASTQRTLAANGYPDAAVHLACGAAPIAPATMDSVVTNPPFHRGHGVDFEVAQLFVRESARVLKAGGKVYLVANAFLQYDPWLKASFSRVDIAWEDRQFRVWEGVK